jgi:hypothetical protein
VRLRRHKDAAPGADERAAHPGVGETAPAEPSGTGTYLTDGRSLFHVQHTITEADGLHLEEPLLELEDCATLELILCSAGALERLGLRAVEPSGEDERRRREEPGIRRTGSLPIRPVRL